MRYATLALALAAAALPGVALAQQGANAAHVKPAPDRTESPLFGAQARAKNGPDPMAAPPSDAGMTPDPPGALPPPPPPVPAPKGG